MEYVYSALLLHSAGKSVDEAGVKKVIEATGSTADTSKIKALVASLKDVNIDEAIKKASIMQVAAAPVAAATTPHCRATEPDRSAPTMAGFPAVAGTIRQGQAPRRPSSTRFLSSHTETRSAISTLLRRQGPHLRTPPAAAETAPWAG